MEGRIEVHMVTCDRVETHHAIWLNFKVTNNEAEYEVVLDGLDIANTLGRKRSRNEDKLIGCGWRGNGGDFNKGREVNKVPPSGTKGV